MLLGALSLACNANAEGWHLEERSVTSPIDGAVHRTVEATLKGTVSGPRLPDPEPVLLAISCENGRLLGAVLPDDATPKHVQGYLIGGVSRIRLDDRPPVQPPTWELEGNT
jgi:hypothetical protein